MGTSWELKSVELTSAVVYLVRNGAWGVVKDGKLSIFR